MTSEEYRAKTGIKTVGQAAAYLLQLRIALAAYMLGWLALATGVYLAWPGVLVMLTILIEVGAFLALAYLAITVLFLTGEPVYAVLVMAIVPFAWFWGYFKLAGPLKIMSGAKPAPAQMPARYLTPRVDPLAPYLAFGGNRFLLALIIVGALIGAGFLIQRDVSGSDALAYRFTSPDNKFAISFPSKPTNNADVDKVIFYSSRGADGEQFMVAAADAPAVNKNGVTIDDQTTYDAMFQGIVQASAGTIDAKDNITTPYGTGVHFVGRMATPTGVNMEGEMIRSNGRVYVMTVLAKDGDPADKPGSAFDFFQSFVLNQ